MPTSTNLSMSTANAKAANAARKSSSSMARFIEIQFRPERGKRPLSESELRLFEELVRCKSREIVEKWIEFLVLKKSIKPEKITRKLKP